MFIVKLEFSHNKDQAGSLMEGHNAWLKQGFDDGIFLLAGSLQPSPGGAVIAHNIDLAGLKSRVNEDPFVAHNVVTADILQIDPVKTDDRLAFLLPGGDQ